MRFFSPLALAGLSLLLLPIAIHLLVRQRAVRRDFPSLRFLRATKSFRLRPQRIQQPLLLALRLLALTMLIVGLAQPWLTRAAGKGKISVILLDASFSMRVG
ncbi:MAG: BatA domain-containing protein, partial [Pyrinomonadaceae bacterium]